MNLVFDTIVHGIGNIANFKGRDRRRTFWLLTLIWFACFLAIWAFIWELGIERLLDNMPSESPSILELLPYWYATLGIVVLGYAFLFGPLLSTAVRRLNDVGVGAKPLKQFGVCLGVPLAFLAILPVLMTTIPEAEPGAQMSWPATLTLLVVVIVLLITILWGSYLMVFLLLRLFKKGDCSENQFGSPPQA